MYLTRHRVASTLQPQRTHGSQRPGHKRALTRTAAGLSDASKASQYFANDPRPIILFDGVCNLCNAGVNFMLDWDQQRVFRLAALQSDAGVDLLQACGRSQDDISSIVLVEPDAFHLRSEAVLRIGEKLNVPLPLLAAAGLSVPIPIRDYWYDAVADNRYFLLGKQDSCRLSDDRFADRFV